MRPRCHEMNTAEAHAPPMVPPEEEPRAPINDPPPGMPDQAPPPETPPAH